MLAELASALAGAGVVGVAADILAVAVMFRPRSTPAGGVLAEGVSVLKPLCGRDDELEANLASFLDLPGAPYEVLLGVRDVSDPAWPLAVAAAARRPDRVRVVVQRGRAGLNPKVNQLVTLADAARFDILAISDSNTRVAPDWLGEIATAFADERLGVLTHPPVGVGGRSLGSRLDVLELNGVVGPGMVVMAWLGWPIVVGKSMAVRRTQLARLGGFEAFADVLAEDWAIGRRVQTDLRLEVRVGSARVENVTVNRSLRSFLDRYTRWSVVQRLANPLPVYIAMVMMHPVALVLAASIVEPGREHWICLAAVVLLRMSCDAALLAERGNHHLSLALLSPLRDLLLAACWFRGLLTREVRWRGTPLQVDAGTGLRPVAPDLEPVELN